MDAKKLWQQKLIMLLHDPPGKAFFLRRYPGGHEKVAGDLFARITGKPLTFVRPEADRAASGADRPVISPPSRTKGKRPISVDWPKHPIVTHPLAPNDGAKVQVDFSSLGVPRRREEVAALIEEVFARLPDEDDDDEDGGATGDDLAKSLASLPLWEDEAQLRKMCLWLWRRWPDLPPDERLAPLWRLQPADSRSPDHSLWDHNRVTSALAFVTRDDKDKARAPWLLAFSIGPVQQFIRQSRTGTDLWTSSMLLSDLMWHAMEPFVEQYGPEAIIYPDLRRNPRADLWLLQAGEEQLLGDDRDPCSYAGIFPNTFVALVPRGGEGALLSLEDLAKRAKARVAERWADLEKLAYVYWTKQAKDEAGVDFAQFKPVWDRQHKDVLFTIWSAAAWPPLEKVQNADALAREGEAHPEAIAERDGRAVGQWRARHEPWIDTGSMTRYVDARAVYAHTNIDIHQGQRGFDYALVHHALFTRHEMRKEEASGARLLDEVGEKCTLCGERQALGLVSGDGGRGAVDAERHRVRETWAKIDPNSDGGAERLCAVCAMKRVLIRAGRTDDNKKAGLTSAWAGGQDGSLDDVLDDDRKLRVPFPSTATLAAQRYLCAVAKSAALSTEVAEVVAAAEAANLPRTTFVRALRSLAETGLDEESVGRRFLEYEAELTAFPEAVASYWRKAKKSGEQGKLRDRRGGLIDEKKLDRLHRAVTALKEAAARNKIPAPATPVAVIAIDGDSIRKLLLGRKIGATWRDVLHPLAAEAAQTNPTTVTAKWDHLLGEQRLMGPSTHAFVNRVLAYFAHVIVPWVVEQEYGGRLVYAGGDDVLALAPAAEALAIAARLSELYRTAWVIDKRPKEKPWSWRKRDTGVSTMDARKRFVVLTDDEGGALPEGATVSPMMGAGQSLSAGIAMGHYKTPLGELVKAARDELEKKAKAGEGKNRFSVRRDARTGEKAALCLGFDEHDKVTETIAAFRSKKISGRLPYKLREVEQAVYAAWDRHENPGSEAMPPEVEELAKGLFLAASERRSDAAFHLWRAGLEEAWRAAGRVKDKHERARALTDTGAEQGLLVCRYLATLDQGKDDSQ
ncbi:MAG: type III-B CRISPR-associated protein Cas10/Cmr2 [Byssovorax sp.]